MRTHICYPDGGPAVSHRCTCPRTFHAIDLENLLGDPTRRDRAHVAEAWERYTARVPIRRDDHIVVATGPSLAVTAWFALPSTVRRLVGYGLDGADNALIDAMDTDHIAARYGRVVIASGDHIFAPSARSLRLKGMQVWQVGGRGYTSDALASVASHRVDLGPDSSIVPSSVA